MNNIILKLGIAVNSFKRECVHGRSHAMIWSLTRLYLRYIRRALPIAPMATKYDRQRTLSIVVPAVKKDAEVLGLCLRSAKKYIQNNILDIMVVAPDCLVVRNIADKCQARWVNEDELLPLPASELKARGWVLQQMIKLNAANHVCTEDYLVLDADTIFLRPQHFFRRGKTVIRYADQYELLYNRSLEMVFGTSKRFPVSFVTHHMVFNIALVKKLLELIEEKFSISWWKVILSEIDQGHLISFSEYELYGNFVRMSSEWKDRFQLEYWAGLDLNTQNVAQLDSIKREANGTLNSVSFHRHTQ